MKIEGLFFPMKVLLKNSVFSIRMCYLLSRLKTLNSMSFLLRFAIEIFFGQFLLISVRNFDANPHDCLGFINSLQLISTKNFF